MPFSVNSNTYINSGLIYFYSLLAFFFVSSHDLGFLNWIPGIVNFSLLGAGHFCFPINILNFFPGMKLRTV